MKSNKHRNSKIQAKRKKAKMRNSRQAEYRHRHCKGDGFTPLMDATFAPLDQEIGKANLEAFMTREENRPEWLYIHFSRVIDAERFLTIVARYEEGVDSLYNRIRGKPDDGTVLGQWEYYAFPRDVAVEETVDEDDYAEQSCEKPSEFEFRFSVRFPSSDYPVLLERMKSYNREDAKTRKPVEYKPETCASPSGKGCGTRNSSLIINNFNNTDKRK
jgi:hypothetical protein